MTGPTKQNKTKQNKTKKHKIKQNKTKKCNQTSHLAFNSFEDEYEKSQIYNLKKANANIETSLVKLFKTPFTTSKITAQDDYYTYINYRWLMETSKSSEKYSKSKKYFSQIDDFRLKQDEVYIQLIDIVKEYIKTDKSKKATAISNVYHSLLNLKSNKASSDFSHFIRFTIFSRTDPISIKRKLFL